MTDPSLLAFPVRRVGSDYATADGERLIVEAMQQTLMSDFGELPWRPAFGAGIAGLLHRHNDPITAELARVRASEALGKWLPAIAQVTNVAPQRDGTKLTLNISYTIGGRQRSTSVVLDSEGGVS